MANIDRRAVEELGIPSMVLMENAAVGVADALGERFPEVETVGILCGPGNNGGDGLAVARHLHARGYEMALATVGDRSRLSGDCRRQLEIVEALGLTVDAITGEADLDRWFALASSWDLLIDALFGTGLSRPLVGLYEVVVDRVATCGLEVLSIDLPSGLLADRAQPEGPAVEATLTVTFAAPKVAHLLPPAAELAGEVVVAGLALPRFLFDAEAPVIELLTADEISSLRAPRPLEGHKGTFGHLLVVAGSLGRSGAAILAARAAVRSGVGLVTVGTPACCVDIVESGSIESMTLPMAATESGTLAASALEATVGSDAYDAWILGPGLGQGEEVGTAIREATRALRCPLVLDADGLNAFAGQAARLAERTEPTVLTPHPGELARLLSVDPPKGHDERMERVREAASTTGAVVVLKGYRTLVADPAGNLAVCPTGNDSLATGGTGDVLAGLLGGFLALGMRAWDAAVCAVFLHGLAADLFVDEYDAESLAATTLVEALAKAMSRV
jgi:NAD(P)H-hydrate epimerase